VFKRGTLPPGPVLGALLLWFAWTLLSAIGTVDWQLTRLTLLDFTGCVLCFAAGFFGLAQVKDRKAFSIGLVLGLFMILTSALTQHFGGLEESRRWFEALPEEAR